MVSSSRFFIRSAILLTAPLTQFSRANPPPSEWQLIVPAVAGQASGGLYFPLQDGFDGSVSWDSVNATPTGTGGNFAPAYAGRQGYIDFGPDFAMVHIMETWTLYRTFSGGSHSGFPVMWWDDDINTANDGGVVETGLNFNSAQGVASTGQTQWIRDKRVNQLGGIIPKRRYLMIQSSLAHTNRAEDFAIVGYIHDGLVPPEYEDALFLSINQNSVAENGVAVQEVGHVTLTGGVAGETYTLELSPAVTDNALFQFDGTTLKTRVSLDYEAKNRYTLAFDAVSSGGAMTTLDLEIFITDVTGAFDTNGPASAAVAAAHPEINEGDFIIWGATNASGPDISYGDNTLAVTYPNKILIKAGNYNKITLDLSGVAGTSAENRVPITNFLGQVYAKQIGLVDGVYWRLTGRHDAAAGLGHEDFPGCASADGDTNFGYSQGRYGFWFSREWEDESSSMVYVGGTAQGWEIDHLEVSDGGFAGMLLKKDSGTVDMDEVHLHHLYIHDTGSEGIYLGSTQADPQHQFNDLTIEHCLILRSGTEALQAGQLGANCLIRNCVLWGAMDWLSPFQQYQDNTAQLGTRQGGTTFRGNILLGGGEKFYNVSNIPKAGITPNGDPIIFENNVNWSCRGRSGAYQFSNTDGVTDWIWRNNFWGGYQFTYDTVYTSSPDSLGCILVATNTIDVEASDNVYDNSRNRVIQSWASGSATITQTNNVQKTVLAPRFLNLLGPGEALDFIRWNRWTARIGEESGFPSNGTNKGAAVSYQPGEVVQHHAAGRTRFYRCLQANTLHEPPAEGDAVWEWMTWEHDGRVQFVPPDDARLVEGSLYHELGIGLRGNGLTDSDHDELPDDWERRHDIDAGSDLGDDGAEGDTDGDGRSHLEEYLANTDPKTSDIFTPPTVTRSGSSLLVDLTPPPGRAWRLETSDQLDAWTAYLDWQPASPTPHTESLSMPEDQGFIRLAVMPESVLNLSP